MCETLIINADLCLQPYEISFTPTLFKLVDHDRAQLKIWLPWVDSTKSQEDSLKFVNMAIQEIAQKKGYYWAIFYKNQIVGTISTHDLAWTHQRTSLGYWLASPYSGQGIMTQSTHAVCNYLFHTHQFNRIEIYAAVGNLKSRAIPERLNFLLEGIMRQRELLNGQFVDHACYGILKKDFK